MMPWANLERLSRAQARRQNVAAARLGMGWPVSAGRQAYRLELERCRERYPLRLFGQAGGTPLTLDCDAEALFPELARQSLIEAGAAAPVLIGQAFEDWFSALEGVFGFALDLTGTAFDCAPSRGAYGLVLRHERSRRAAHFALDSEAVHRWLERQPVAAGELDGSIVVPLPVCVSGPRLTPERTRAIRPGDALLLQRSSWYLRVPLRRGARRLALKTSGETMMVSGPMMDDDAAPGAEDRELVATGAVALSFDAVIGTISLTLDELVHLRSGSVLSLQTPLEDNSVLLLCQGVPFARGELIAIDDALAVRIVDPMSRSGSRREAGED